MRKILVMFAAIVLLSPLAGHAPDGRAALENVATALGAVNLRSIQVTGSGVNFAVGQSPVPGAPWPRFKASLPHPVLGDIPVEVSYSDYRDFGGVLIHTTLQAPDWEEPSVIGRINRWKRIADRFVRVTCREEPERIVVISAVFKRRPPARRGEA